MSGKEFDGWCVVREDEYKNKTDIFTCLSGLFFIWCYGRKIACLGVILMFYGLGVELLG